MTKRLTAVLTVLAVGVLAGAVDAEVIVYPKPGQSQDQQPDGAHAPPGKQDPGRRREK